MSTLAAVIVLLATAGVVRAVFNIAYDPEEYEYEDMRPDELPAGLPDGRTGRRMAA